MSSMSTWTYGDMAMLTDAACRIAAQDALHALIKDAFDGTCERCGIETVTATEKYCMYCADVICDALAVEHKEKVAVDGGLY